MNVVLFIDYDNLHCRKTNFNILNAVTSALNQIAIPAGMMLGECEVRIYGGWYEENNMTRRAQELSVSLQDDFPAIVRAHNEQGQICAFSVSATLALSLMEDPDVHLCYTYRKKGRPNNLHVKAPAEIGCKEPNCPLFSLKKLLKDGKCKKPSCSIKIDDLISRHEQKAVDTMLACDIIYASQFGFNKILLISSDDDFIPPLRIALIRGSSVIRFHTEINTRRNIIHSAQNQLIELEL